MRVQDDAWQTYFESLGARWTPYGDWTFVGQWLHGRTMVDAELPHAWSFHANPAGEPAAPPDALLGALRPLPDATDLQQLRRPSDLLADDGHAWTVACIRDLGQHWSAALEGIQSESQRATAHVHRPDAYARDRCCSSRCATSFSSPARYRVPPVAAGPS